MRKIILASGRVALVDDEDFEYLIQFKWYEVNNNYTIYATTREAGATLLMHGVIMNPLKTMVVDHVDGDGLNNQKNNLRICTISQNLANSRKSTNNKHSSSIFRGVSYASKIKRWMVYVGNNYVGVFKDEIEAAKAYDKEALKLYGEFARPNFK